MLKAATAKTNTADAMIKMGVTFMMISYRQSEIKKTKIYKNILTQY